MKGQKFLIHFRRKDKSANCCISFFTTLPESYPDYTLWSMAVRRSSDYLKEDLDKDTWEVASITAIDPDQEGGDDQ